MYIIFINIYYINLDFLGFDDLTNRIFALVSEIALLSKLSEPTDARSWTYWN